MAQLVQFRNKGFICLIAIILGCNLQEKEQTLSLIKNSGDKNISSQNGIVFYEQNPYTGYILTLYPNQKDTAMICGFLNGAEHGVWKKFYPNGKLQEIRVYQNGKKIDQYNAYWENGAKKLAYNFKNDEYEGLCMEWNQDGQLVKVMNYVNGYEEGPQKLFYDDGKVKANYTIINGRRYGLLGNKNCINVSD